MATPDWSSIPKPKDDGACDHLRSRNVKFPSVAVPSTAGQDVTIAELDGLTVIFFYPRTAAPGEVVPEDWNSIPGARGCTPQACSFRDASDELSKLGVQRIFGCSTQSTEYQQELKGRTKLHYELLSDEKLEISKALKLPMLEWQGKQLTKRVTIAVRDGEVMQVWYRKSSSGDDDHDTSLMSTSQPCFPRIEVQQRWWSGSSRPDVRFIMDGTSLNNGMILDSAVLFRLEQGRGSASVALVVGVPTAAFIVGCS